MKKQLALLLILALIFGAMVGCTNAQGDEPVEPTNGGGDNREDETGNTPVEPTPPTASGRTDLVIAIDSDISTMHASDYSTSNENDLGAQIYEGLMRVTDDGLEPCLAKSWDVAEDGMTYTFYLRDDVTFHDGTPFTAEDVKFSAELFQQSVYQGAVVDGLDYVEIKDDHTVVMVTTTVFSPFLENIASMNIACKSYYDAVGVDKFASDPIGTGPYVFVSHDLGSKITLKAYEDYYLGEAAIKDVVFRVLSDDATVALSLQTGELDFVSINETNFYNIDGKEGITIQEVPSSRFGFISMNHEQYPYSEVKFRQAVAYAIDRQNLVDLALDGIGDVNSNLISPLRFGWSASQPEYTYDPDKSTELLAELGIEVPYDLGIMPVAEAYRTQAEVIQSDLKKVGLIVELEVLEHNALLGNLFNGQIGITTMAMSLEGVTQSYAMALTTPYVGMANNVRYSNPEIDALFEEAVQAINEEARFEIYDEIFTRVQEEAVFVVLYNNTLLFAHSDELHVPKLPLEGAYRIYDMYWMS